MVSGRRARLGCTALLLLCLGAAPARAEGPAVPAGALSLDELWARGERAYRDGDLAAAQRDFEAALARDEGRGRSWSYLGGVHFARGDLVRAREHFERARALDPGDVRACNNLATVHERLGELARAEELYQQAALQAPAYAPTFRNLGVLYARRLGRPDAARRAWERYLQLAPPGPDAEAVRRELEALPPVAPPLPGP